MSLRWSSKGFKATPVAADELLILDSADANPSTTNKRIAIGTLPTGDILPVADTTAIVEGSADDTKLLRFEIDGFTTATTRILTPPDASGIIVLEDFAQTLTNKTITAAANTLIIASTDLTDTANIVLNNQTNSYTAGVRQNFLGDTSGTAGLNVGAIAGNPTTQADADLWLNTSSNILFARINGVDVNLSAAGEVFTWTANHDADGFALEAPLFADPLDNTKLLAVDLAGNTTLITLTLDINQTTNQILSIPNITASDVLLTENFPQTLTNKTMTAAANSFSGFVIGTEVTGASTNLTDTADIAYLNTANVFIAGNLNQFGHNATNAGLRTVPFAGNPSVQNDGEIWYNLTTNQLFGRINGVDVDLGATGSQTPWVSDINAATFDLTNLSNIEFTTTTLAPGGTVQAIYADAGGIIINVPTSDTVLLKINDVGQYSFGVDDLDMQVNGLFDVENIVFAETLGAPAGGVHAIYVDTGGMIFNSANTDDFDFQINASSEYVFTDAQAEWNSNDLIEMGILSFSDVNTSLQQSVSDLLVDVASGGTIVLRVADATEYAFDAADADFNTNNIINATFNAASQTLVSNIDETMQTVDTGAAATVLTSNGVGVAPTYQAVAGTGDVIGPASATDESITRFDGLTGKLIQDGVITIDDVANMLSIRSLQFTTFGSAPTGTTHIALVNSDFHINTTTGNSLQLMVNDVLEYQFDSTSADFNGNNLIMGGAYIQFTSIASPGNSGAATVGRIFLDSGNSNHLTVRRNDGIDVDLEGGSQTPWISDIDADGFDLQDLSNIEFRETTSIPAGTVPYIAHEATGITLNVPTSDSFNIDINNTPQYIFSSGSLGMNNNNLDLGTGQIQFATGGTTISEQSSDLIFDVSVGDFFSFDIAGTPEYTFGTTTADFNNNSITNATIDGDLNNLLDINETQMTVSVGAADTILTSNGVAVAPTYQSLFPINFPENAGGNATATQDIDFSINDRHSQQYTLTQNTTLTFSGTVASTTEYIDLFIVQDGTGGFSLTLPIGTVNKAEVEAGVNLGAGEETFILLKFAFGTFYAFLQGTQTAGNSQTPWVSDIDADGFDLKDLSNIEFRTETTGPVSGAINFINTSLTTMFVNVPFGNTIQLQIAGDTEYLFTTTEADFSGNNIQDIPQILDSNGAELLIFTTTASAVNELTLVNAATLTPVELQASGGDTDVDVRFVPKGAGTFYGNRETWSWPLTDETTAPTTGVKFTTEPSPYDMAIEDAIAGLTTAGTGAALFTIDVLKEDSVNADTFTTIFSTLPTIDASEFTSTTAATAPVISVSTWEKGRRLQLSISILDTDGLARGSKVSLLTHATAK